MCIFVFHFHHPKCSQLLRRFLFSSCRRWISSLGSQRLKRNLLLGDRKFCKVFPDALSSLPLPCWVSWSETSRVPVLSLTNREHWSTLSTFFKRKQHDFPPTMISVATKLCFLCPLCFYFCPWCALPGMGWTVMQLLSDLSATLIVLQKTPIIWQREFIKTIHGGIMFIQ